MHLCIGNFKDASVGAHTHTKTHTFIRDCDCTSPHMTKEIMSINDHKHVYAEAHGSVCDLRRAVAVSPAACLPARPTPNLPAAYQHTGSH